MRLFDRTPTGRPRKSRHRLSYSKTDKPLIHKLKRAFSTKKTQFMFIGICICLIFIILILYSPTPTSSQPSYTNNNNNDNNNNNNILFKNNSLTIDEIINKLADKSDLSDKLRKLVNKFADNANNIDINHIEELLTHRNDLEKYLSGIDDLLLAHKDKITDVLPINNNIGNNNNNNNNNKQSESRLKKENSKIKEKSKISKLKELQSELHKQNNIKKDKKEELILEEEDEEQLNKSPSEIRIEIITEFKYAFGCYKKCAWGYDTVHPISCTGTNDAFDLGLAMIDSLDTMIIMNMHDYDIELERDINSIREWITNKMHFNKKTEVSLFESTIRVLGGLLSAYNLTSENIYLTRATELGNKLMYAFDTATGIPYASVDFTNNRGFNPSWSRSATSTSEAASIQLEFNYLSYLTNDNKYANTARKSQMKVIDAQKRSNPPLLRKFINIESGTFSDNKISFGSRIDSTYEYYIKVPLQLGRHPETDIIWDMYIASIETAEKELFLYTAANNYLYIAEKNGNQLSDQFDHLVCFIGGSLALGSLQLKNENKIELSNKHFNYGIKLTDTCYSIYKKTPTHLAPEIVYFSRNDKINDFDIHSRDKHNLLRPETVESIFYLWRITHKQKYRNYGYKIFLAFKKYTKMDGKKGCGYGSINDVTVKNKNDITFKNDKMESFFLAETLKYLYLLFSNDDVININKYIFNTEAHPLPRLTEKEADKLFK